MSDKSDLKRIATSLLGAVPIEEYVDWWESEQIHKIYSEELSREFMQFIITWREHRNGKITREEAHARVKACLRLVRKRTELRLVEMGIMDDEEISRQDCS